MGAFPIQSNTSCLKEWIENEKTGLLVPPNDPAATGRAISHLLHTREGGALVIQADGQVRQEPSG